MASSTLKSAWDSSEKVEFANKKYTVVCEFKSKRRELNNNDAITFQPVIMEVIVDRKHIIRNSSLSLPQSITSLSSFVPNLISEIDKHFGSFDSTKETVQDIVRYVHVNEQVMNRIEDALSRFLYYETQGVGSTEFLIVSIRLNYELFAFSYNKLLEENDMVMERDLRVKLVVDSTIFNWGDDVYDFNDQTMCAICLEEFEGMKCLVVELPCKHFFHISCAFQWIFDRNRSCPLCRSRIA